MGSVGKPPPKWFWFASLLGCTPGFRRSRCKKLLKVTMRRIKLLRGRREVQVRQLRQDVAKLLGLGQEQSAESRLDRLWREHSLLSVYLKTGEYCQFVKANLTNIAWQRECPMDLREPLASLCFAASCCADLPELQEIREILVLKYGKDFFMSASELRPSSFVNKEFLEAFATKEPSEMSKQALLKGVMTEHRVVKPPLKERGLQNLASSTMLEKTRAPAGVTDRNPSRHVKNLKSASFKNLSKEAPKQEEGLSKQTRSSAAMESIHGEAAIPRTEQGYSKLDDGGQGEIKVRRKKKGHHHCSSDGKYKEEHKSKLKAYKRDARIHQLIQEDQHAFGNGWRSVHEKAEPQGVTGEMNNGYHRHSLPEEPDKKFGLERKGNGSPSVWPRMPEYGSESPGGHVGHKTGKEKRPAEVNGVQPWGDAEVIDEFNTHQTPQIESKRELLSGANGTLQLGRATDEYDNVKKVEKQLHEEYIHVDTRRDVHSMSRRTSRKKRIEHDGVQKENRVDNEWTWTANVENNKVEMAKKDTNELPNGHGQSSPNSTEALIVGSVDSHRETKHASRKSTHECIEMELPPTDRLDSSYRRERGRKGRLKKKHVEVAEWEAETGTSFLTVEKVTIESSPHMQNPVLEHHQGHKHNPVSKQHQGHRHGWRGLPRQDDNLSSNAHILGSVETGQNFNGASAGNAPETKKVAGMGNRPLDMHKKQMMHRDERRLVKHHHHHYSDEELGDSNGSRREQEDARDEPRTCDGPSLVHAHKDEIVERSFDMEGLGQTRYLEPPRRPPPPVPPRVSSMPSQPPFKSPPVPVRSTTLEPKQLRQIQEPHVHPKLPEYEDLVASFAALRNKESPPTK